MVDSTLLLSSASQEDSAVLLLSAQYRQNASLDQNDYVYVLTTIESLGNSLLYGCYKQE